MPPSELAEVGRKVVHLHHRTHAKIGRVPYVGPIAQKAYRGYVPRRLVIDILLFLWVLLYS